MNIFLFMFKYVARALCKTMLAHLLLTLGEAETEEEEEEEKEAELESLGKDAGAFEIERGGCCLMLPCTAVSVRKMTCEMTNENDEPKR